MSCSGWGHPDEAVLIGESVIKCWNCYEKHKTVIDSFQNPPKECVLCRRTFEQLAAANAGNPVSMFVHEIDGTFGMLCAPCDKEYVLKRKDLYRKTRFGWDRKV